MTNQQNKVLRHMQIHGFITSPIAIEKFNITRLAAVIYDLKKLGHDIKSSGKGKFAKYSLVGHKPEKSGRGWLSK